MLPTESTSWKIKVSPEPRKAPPASLAASGRVVDLPGRGARDCVARGEPRCDSGCRLDSESCVWHRGGQSSAAWELSSGVAFLLSSASRPTPFNLLHPQRVCDLWVASCLNGMPICGAGYVGAAETSCASLAPLAVGL